MRQTVALEPISRRMFLAASAAIVVTACSGSDDQSSTSTPDSSGQATSPVPPTQPASGDPPTSTPAPTSGQLPPVDLGSDPFTLGVASGDPSPTSVVLWTRLAPDPLVAAGGIVDEQVTVRYELAIDPGFATLIGGGTALASMAHAHSVHVTVQRDEIALDDVTMPIFYRFTVNAPGGYVSPTGSTRFAPSAGAAVDTCTFASASCQHYESGYYVAHREIAQRQPDFVVFLGDYIYEGGAGTVGQNDNVRTHGTPEVTTLDEYRARYALYKRDPDLQAAHAACPWMITWDDHEVENNYAGAVPQGAGDQALFTMRRDAAHQAWWEHQPVALPAPTAGQDFPIYRSFHWGSLLTVAMLDGRQYRSDQACGGGTLNLDPVCAEALDPARTMLGDEQEAWLFDVLHDSTTTWKVLAQQTVFGDVTLGDAVLNYDQWDGYPVQRNRIVDRLANDQIGNVVVLTGDIHFAGTGVVRSGGRGTGVPVGVEFTTTSISSGGRINPAVTEVVRAIPDIVDVELDHRGYISHTVTAPQWEAQYRMVDTVKQPDSALFQHARYRVEAGSNLVAISEGVVRDTTG